MARTSHENSKRNFKWMIRKGSRRVSGGDSGRKQWEEVEEKDVSSFSIASSHTDTPTAAVRKKTSAAATAVSRFRSAVAAAIASRRHSRSATTGGGLRMTGTLYGNRRGHVNLALQVDSRACPVVVLELPMPTSVLVREMASGLVRIALECGNKAGGKKLMEENMWRTYCNGRKCGYAVRHESGPTDWKVLKAVEPVSMGAGVLPVDSKEDEGPDGEMIYMRATFERVVGSKDSEAFYMMNPDGHCGTELSIYFLRV